MGRAVIGCIVALYIGIALGYLGRGERDRRAASDLVRDLDSITRQLEQHERVLAELVVQREAKTTAALSECEQTSERVAKQLEGCLFEKAGAARGAQADPTEPRKLSGTAPFQESIGYPVPIAPKPRKD